MSYNWELDSNGDVHMFSLVEKFDNLCKGTNINQEGFLLFRKDLQKLIAESEKVPDDLGWEYENQARQYADQDRGWK